MKELTKNILRVSKNIQAEINKSFKPPDDGTDSQFDLVLSRTLFKGTRGYLEKVVTQINGCYEKGWYDSCSVMIRRLIETLIIECFEAHNIANKIKTSNGDFYYLNDLINLLLNEPTWNLGRNARSALPRLKNIGDKSAHSRRFTAIRKDIDKLSDDLRNVAQELLYLSNLK